MNFSRSVEVQGNEMDATGFGDWEEKASKRDVGGGLAMLRLAYKSGSDDVNDGMMFDTFSSA